MKVKTCWLAAQCSIKFVQRLLAKGNLHILRGTSSRKGMKYTTAQLASKKQRVELTVKQKCDVIDQAKKQGFLPDSVESTILRVNQTMLAKQFNVTAKTINRVLWNAKKLKQQFLSFCIW